MSKENINKIINICRRCSNNYNYYNVLGMNKNSSLVDMLPRIKEVVILFHPDQELFVLDGLPYEYHEMYFKIKEDVNDIVDTFNSKEKRDRYDYKLKKINSNKYKEYELERKAELLLNNKIKETAKSKGWIDVCIALYCLLEYSEIDNFCTDKDGTNNRLLNIGTDRLKAVIIKKSINDKEDLDNWKITYNYLSNLFINDNSLSNLIEILEIAINNTNKYCDKIQTSYAIKYFVKEKSSKRIDYFNTYLYNKNELLTRINIDDVDPLIRIRLNGLRLEENDILFSDIFNVPTNNIIDLYVDNLYTKANKLTLKK